MSSRARLRRAIRETVKRIRRQRSAAWGKSRSQIEAGELLTQRYVAWRRELRGSKNYEDLSCVCKLDRVVFTASALPVAAFTGIPGYRFQKTRNLWGPWQLYRHARAILGTGSVRQVVVEFDPKYAWAPEYRITILPRDQSGLLPVDLDLILGMFDDFNLVLLEIPFDFPIGSIVDIDYMRRYGLSGKSWLVAGSDPLYDKWGSSAGLKVIRSYPKWEIFAHRVEIELHSSFLRQHAINRPTDFPRLASILPEKHIFFARLDKGKLVNQLRLHGRSARSIKRVLGQVEDLSNSLWGTLAHLRKRQGLKNVQRLLVPLENTNRVVREAIEKWAADWAEAQSRFGKP